MNCRKCRKEIPDGAVYCQHCGVKQSVDRLPKSRGNGQGSAYKLPNGTWRAAVCLGYLACVGWYLTVCDVLALLLDVFLLTMFGTALSSCLHYFLTTQGQLSAVGTLVSAGYGFICGAYMPMSNFPEGLQKVLSFLPGTYATSLLHNHWMRGALNEMGDAGVPGQVLDAIRDGIDCNIYFSGEAVSQGTMYLILAGSVVVVTAAYVLINALCKPRYGDR